LTERRAKLRALVLRASALVFVLLLAAAVLAFPERVRIPKLSPHPPGAPSAAAVFSHGRHTAMACYGCHPGIFPQAPVGFSHREMLQGLYCGACHGRGEAPAIGKMACQECHAER
jgi:c(7)-type cytochrome triheme protein